MELSEYRAIVSCLVPQASVWKSLKKNRDGLHEADEEMQCIRGDLLAHSEKKIGQLWWGPAISAKR